VLRLYMLRVCLGESSFQKSRWFTGGWTFQELVVPVFVAGGGDQSKVLKRAKHEDCWLFDVFFFFFSEIEFFWRERRSSWKHVRYLAATAVVALSFLEESAMRTRSAQRKSPQAMIARNWRATRYTDPAVDIRKFLLESYQSSVIIIPRPS